MKIIVVLTYFMHIRNCQVWRDKKQLLSSDEKIESYSNFMRIFNIINANKLVANTRDVIRFALYYWFSSDAHKLLRQTCGV
jgi:hypothetical protein